MKQGIACEIGPKTFFQALNEFRIKNNWPGFIKMVGIYKKDRGNVKAMSNVIYHELKSGRKVKFYFAYTGPTWQTVYRASPVIELESLKQAMELFMEKSKRSKHNKM